MITQPKTKRALSFIVQINRKERLMFYLVGLKTHEGQDWIYKISEDKVIKVWCAHGNDWHYGLLSAYGCGADLGNEIIYSVENLDFISLPKKRTERILRIISKYHRDSTPSIVPQRGGYWAFAIPRIHKETSTL